jgi:hypothetical protein
MPPKLGLDLSVQAELETQYLRVQVPVSAERLWKRVLNQQERQRLGDNLAQAYARLGTVGIWIELRGVSPARAVVDLARVLGFLDETNYRWLLRGLGEDGDRPTAPDRPTWNPQQGDLRWKKQVLRRVRVMAAPSNVQIILDAFQATHWAQQICNPLPHGQQQLHQALRSLNRGLKKIRFHAREGGQAIRWDFR